jgi:hypothetical protein
MFPFLPFGFSIIFCILFFCIQKAIFDPRHLSAPHYRAAFEQTSNFLYILLLFIFRSAPFGTLQFISTVILSQTCVFLASNRMVCVHKKLMSIYDNYAKYQR